MTQPLRVLLVDDNPDDRALVARELAREYDGVVIIEAIDRAQLDAEMSAGSFDLVITDYHIQWTDGLRVLREVKARRPDAPIIMFTGTGNEEVAAEAMRLGLDDYVIKSPSHLKRLVPAVRRALERAAERRERTRLAHVVTVTPDLVGTADVDGLTRYLNPGGRRMLGIPEDEDLSGVPLVAFHTVESARILQEEALPAARATGSWRGDLTLRTRTGKDISVSQVILVHYDQHGAVEYLSTIARDVTRERSLQAQLHHAQKMEAVGRLAGGVAHDFNNLLTVILGECELALADGDKLDLEHRGSLETVLGAAMRGAMLTRHLLAFSRTERAKSSVFDPNQLITDLDRLLQRVLEENMTLEQRLGANVNRVELDRGGLEQVMVNLVVNARDAMSDGGTVTIETRNVSLAPDEALMHGDIEPGEYVCISVRDTGSGISAAVKERLFEPFFTTKEEGKGTGLGLATSYAIVREAGGYIAVYSEVGLGSTFHVYLPEASMESASAAPEPVREEVRGGSESILLVEDDAVLRTISQRMLTRLGYRVVSAENGEDALELVRKAAAPFDLLLTDVVLPGIGGQVVASQVRAAWPRVKILFASGYSGEVLERHQLLKGETYLLRKPFTITELARKVRETLDHK